MYLDPQSGEALFRAEIAAFLDAQLTPDLQEAGRATTHSYSPIVAARAWHRLLHAQGWVAPLWPVEHGGAGWTTRQRLIFEQECACRDAPILFAGGIRTIGPLLIAQGSAEQRARYLPAILDGTDLWCQGFSEPQAGSDLAALALSARRDGDSYILNGSKIWTTGAHDAQRMFALVRTDGSGKRQDGITFLLIDLDTPGITIRPIISISGDHELNQVFFDEVRVPVSQRVGAEDEGWAVAKLLMRFARASNTTSGLVRRALAKLDRLIALQQAADASLGCRRAALAIELDALEALELRLLGGTGEIEDVAASTLKLAATELHQRITELAIEVAAADGLPAGGMAGPGPLAMRKYLNTRAASIYSGTNETHRNLLGSALARR